MGSQKGVGDEAEETNFWIMESSGVLDKTVLLVQNNPAAHSATLRLRSQKHSKHGEEKVGEFCKTIFYSYAVTQ